MAFGGGRVAGLKIELEIDGSKFTKYLSTAAREVNKVQSSLKDLEKSLKLNPRSTELLTQKQKLLGEAVNKTRDYLVDLKNQYERLSSLQNPTEKQREQMDKLAREISDVEVKLKDLTRQFELFSVTGEKVKSVGASMQALGNQISSSGSSISSLGMQISRLSAPIAAAFGYGIKETMSFEQSMANVRAVTGATGEEFERLEKAAIDMSKTTIYSADETAEALYFMGLAGWDADKSIAALPGVLDLAAAGQVDLGQATSITVDAMNAMGIEVEGSTNGIANAAHFTNVLAAAMSNSNTTVELLGESFKYAAQMGGTLDYSIEDVTLALGLMANTGVKGSQAGTGLRMALKNLADESKLAAAEARGFKIEMDDGYGKALPLRDVIEQLRDQFGGLNLELLDADGNLKEGEQLWEEYGDTLPATQMEKFRALTELVGVRALPGIMGAINASEESFISLADAIDGADQGYVRMYGELYPLTEAVELFGQELIDTEGELMGTAEAMREIQLSTAEGQIQLLKDNFAALAIELGKEVIPYIIEFAQYLSSLIDRFRNLSPATKKTILVIAGIVAALGPVLVTIGQIVMGIGGLITFIGKIVSAIGTVISVISAVVGAVGALPVVIGAIVIALIAFIVTHWEEFKAAMVELWTSFKEFFVGLWEGIKKTFAEAAQQIRDKWEDFKNKIIAIIEAIRQKWDDFKNKLAAIIEAIKQKWDSFKQKVEDIKNSVVSKVEDLKTKIKNAFDAIKRFIQDPIGEAKKFIDDKIQAIKNLFPIYRHSK